MEEFPRTPEDLQAEVDRLRWRISTLETVETECTRALAALAASEARYRRLLDEAGFPITISRADDARILFANPLACRMFGLEGPRPARRSMLAFYQDPADRARLVARLRDQGTLRDWEVMLRDGAGQSRVLIVTASLITYEGEEALLATSNDITERRHVEALFRSLVESSPDGIGMADLEGCLTYVSPPLFRMFGYDHAEEVLGRNLREFIAREEHARILERLQAILAGRPAGPSEWTGLRRDGSSFPQEINGEVLRHPDGTPRVFFFILRDLTNRKRLERAIRWSEKLESLGLMAAGIAHELNNAFQVTQGHLELAQDLAQADPRLADLLRGMGGGVDRAALLARDMLAYSGQTLRAEAPVPMARVVDEVLALRRAQLRSRISVGVDLDPDLPPVHGDESQVMKVFSAFLLNAAEALEETEGALQITVDVRELGGTGLSAGFWPVPGREGRFVCLEVRDDGIGMTAAQVLRSCDPFFTTKGPGRGLGLSAAMGILRAHSACLQILSQPGGGTTLRAYFPTVGAAPAGPGAPEAMQPVGRGILVAEDDAAIRELVVQMLPRWGYAPVFAASHGAEALALFRDHPEAIGLFLTDATMPHMSGPEAFEAMRSLKPSLRGVLMSGYSEAFGQGTAESSGFHAFLQKPFTFTRLKARLEEAQSGTPVPGPQGGTVPPGGG